MLYKINIDILENIANGIIEKIKESGIECTTDKNIIDDACFNYKSFSVVVKSNELEGGINYIIENIYSHFMDENKSKKNIKFFELKENAPFILSTFNNDNIIIHAYKGKFLRQNTLDRPLYTVIEIFYIYS